MKISKNKKNRFFLMFQGSLDPKIRFLGQKVCSVARVHTKVNTEFLQPIIKDRSNNYFLVRAQKLTRAADAKLKSHFAWP